MDSEIYVLAIHWSRACYRQALKNSNLEVKLASTDDFMKFTVVPLGGGKDKLVKARFEPRLRSQLRTCFAPGSLVTNNMISTTNSNSDAHDV